MHRQHTKEERKPLLFTNYGYYGNEKIYMDILNVEKSQVLLLNGWGLF